MGTEKKIIRGEVDTSYETRKHYSRDASIFEVGPAAVCYPKDPGDLSALINYATEQRLAGVDISLTARNAGTDMSGGPLTESIVVDVSRHFNHIGAVDVHARTVAVQGGVMHLDVEKATHPKGLYFAPYTSSRDICGIGGMLGNNASGERSIKYGPTSSNVDRIKVMLADGNEYIFGPLSARQVEAKKHLPSLEGKIYRELTDLLEDNRHLIEQARPGVRKNAAGYALWDLWDKQRHHFNLARLFIGAQGTLGIITEAELKLIPIPKHFRMVLTPVVNLHDLSAVVKIMLAHKAEACETYDHFTYELAKKYYPEDAKRANLAEGKHMVVFAMYAGDTAEHAEKLAKTVEAALNKGGFKSDTIEDNATVESHLLIRRKSFKMLLDHPHGDGKKAMAFLEDTIVPMEHYGDFLASLEDILADYDMIYTYAGHIGDGSIRLVPLVKVGTDKAADKIIELSRRVYDLVFAFGGSISADHNDGLIRTPFLERMYGPEMVTLFARVKELFDPLGIFNPRKKVGGSLEYTKAHIIKD